MSPQEKRELFSLCHWITSDNDIPTETKNKYCKSFKKRLRAARDAEELEDEIHYSEDGESCWCKEYFNEPFTEEEKYEWMNDHWVYINSPYDCTGKWFTRSIVVCNVNTSFGAKSVVYYLMGRDV